MRIVFLGTSGYHPNERRHTAGLLFPELGLLLDAGTGTFRVPDRLDTGHLSVFLTHAHLDHICGLTYLVVPVITKEITQLDVYARAETIKTVRSHLFSKPVFPVEPDCQFHELDDQGVLHLSEEVNVTWMPLWSHPGGSMAFRVTQQQSDGSSKSLAYVTDTSTDGSYSKFIAGVDVLVHECYFPDNMREWAEKTGHSCVSDVANLAKEVGASKLVLTHIDPRHDDDDPVGMATAEKLFPGTILAEDLMEITI